MWECWAIIAGAVAFSVLFIASDYYGAQRQKAEKARFVASCAKHRPEYECLILVDGGKLP